MKGWQVFLFGYQIPFTTHHTSTCMRHITWMDFKIIHGFSCLLKVVSVKRILHPTRSIVLDKKSLCISWYEFVHTLNIWNDNTCEYSIYKMVNSMQSNWQFLQIRKMFCDWNIRKVFANYHNDIVRDHRFYHNLLLLYIWNDTVFMWAVIFSTHDRNALMFCNMRRICWCVYMAF